MGQYVRCQSLASGVSPCCRLRGSLLTLTPERQSNGFTRPGAEQGLTVLESSPIKKKQVRLSDYPLRNVRPFPFMGIMERGSCCGSHEITAWRTRDIPWTFQCTERIGSRFPRKAQHVDRRLSFFFPIILSGLLVYFLSPIAFLLCWFVQIAKRLRRHVADTGIRQCPKIGGAAYVVQHQRLLQVDG